MASAEGVTDKAAQEEARAEPQYSAQKEPITGAPSAQVASPAMAEDPDLSSTLEPLSKKQQKKLRKQAAHEARKAAKKASEKAAKKAHQEAKLTQVKEKLAKMDEDERRAWDQQRLERQQVTSEAFIVLNTPSVTLHRLSEDL